MTTRRRRADLDDADLPEFITEHTAPEKKIPRCCRCGRDVPATKTLWTLCEYCVMADLEITDAPPRHPQGTQAVIGDLARKMALSLGKHDGDHTPLPPPAVLHHEARLMARGIDQTAARRLAIALTTDRAHRAGCEICQASAGEIRERLERPNEETARYAGIGRSHLPLLGRKSLPCRD